MKFRAIIPSAAFLMLAGCEGGGGTEVPEALPLPASIYTCEIAYVLGAQHCGYWTLQDSVYIGEWPQGQKAIIRVRRFDEERAMFSREDTPESVSYGVKAEYNARMDGTSVEGTVWWTWPYGGQDSGKWTARW